MEARYEADLQSHVTRAFRSREFLGEMGLLESRGCLVEGKHVWCAGCDGKNGLAWAEKCNSVEFATLYRTPCVVDACGATRHTGSPPWKACRKALPFSAIPSHERTSLERAAGRGVPLSFKMSDSAIGFKPCDMFALWGVWSGYWLGWCCGGVSRFYLVPSERVEALMVGKRRGSISEADAWRESGGRCVVVDGRK